MSFFFLSFDISNDESCWSERRRRKKNATNDDGVDIKSVYRKTVYFWHLLLFQLKYLRFFWHKGNCLSRIHLNVGDRRKYSNKERMFSEYRTYSMNRLKFHWRTQLCENYSHGEFKWRLEFHFTAKISSWIWHVSDATRTMCAHGNEKVGDSHELTVKKISVVTRKGRKFVRCNRNKIISFAQLHSVYALGSGGVESHSVSFYNIGSGPRSQFRWIHVLHSNVVLLKFCAMEECVSMHQTKSALTQHTVNNRNMENHNFCRSAIL